MTFYEIKKVFVKMSSKLALVLLCIVLIIICNSAMNNVDLDYVNENGETDEQGLGETGRTAALKLREEKQQWEGPLTQEKLEQVIRENVKISASKEARSSNVTEQNIAEAKKQGFSDIRWLLCYAYGKNFKDFDYDAPDSLKPEDAAKFYDLRVSNLKNWLNGEGGEVFTEQEKSFLIKQYQELKEPLLYECADGWNSLFYFSPMLIMLTILIIGFLLCGIFSCESQLKTDAVFYSSYHGRRKAVMAKIKAGLAIASGIYWLMVLLYSGIVLGLLGASGSQCMIQSTSDGWESFYNITIGQEYLMIVLGGYVGCLFIALLVMFLSAKMKSPVLAAAVPLILVLTPSFLKETDFYVIDKVLGLLPDQLMQMRITLRNLNLYSIGDKVIGSILLLFIMYLALTLILCPILYQNYRRAEVK